MKRSDLFLKKLMKHVLRHRLVPEGFRLEYEIDRHHDLYDESVRDYHLFVTNGVTRARVQLADEKVCVFIERDNEEECGNPVYIDDIRPHCKYTGSEKQATQLFAKCLAELPHLDERMTTLITAFDDIKAGFERLFGEEE